MNIEVRKSTLRCVVCAALEFVGVFRNHRVCELRGKTIEFEQDLECCLRCGLVRQRDNVSYSDTNLAEYYSRTYRTPVDSGAVGKDDKRKKNAGKRLRFVRDVAKPGTLLEVGFGDGVFISEAQEYFECTGIDPSQGYSDVKRFLAGRGIDIYSGSLGEFMPRKQFDVICAFLVLEHIKRPDVFVNQLKTLLKPTGVMIIEVPDIDRYRVSKSVTMLTHEHVYHYSGRTLGALMSGCGLCQVKFTNRNVSYGFSLLAAFEPHKRCKHIASGSAFESLSAFQEYLQVRERYRNRMASVLTSVIKKSKGTTAVYGTGFLYTFAVDHCGLRADDLAFLFEDTAEKIGTTIGGKKVRALSDIGRTKPEMVLVFSEMFFDLMKKNILKHVDERSVQIINVHGHALGA
jgi:SAM-dependent methyltransferase